MLEFKGRTPVVTGYDEKYCDKKDFEEIIERINNFFPGRPLLEIWKSYFRGGSKSTVCLESIIDPLWDFWASLESDCKEYGWTIDEVMNQEIDYLSIFRIIRGAKNWYQRIQNEQDLKKFNKQK